MTALKLALVTLLAISLYENYRLATSLRDANLTIVDCVDAVAECINSTIEPCWPAPEDMSHGA